MLIIFVVNLYKYVYFFLLQVLCSCFAGVYSEFLLKNKGLHVDIFLQNIFMYFDSIICGILMLLFQWNTFFFTKESWEMIFQPKVSEKFNANFLIIN